MPYEQDDCCFLILGKEKALLWDTGMGIDHLRPLVEKITDLPVTVLISHDHLFSHAVIISVIRVSINKNKYALYRLYGGSLLEAVDINPANPAMLAALVNMLVSANKGLSGQQTQQQSDNQDNTEQNDQQNNQQNAQNAQNQQTQQPQQPQQNNQENTNQKQMSTNVQGVPFTVQTGKPVQMV